ncbi:hypothetical protein [Porphyrobacter sp. CACIAM 03H1]|uniref:hypothetical protein n=1 Tax=Porphyrobacter sp. CACIAM 03H1 TaxID=2003315 RepID=UPI0012FDF315|nr:hypothetical protein [Porphyrobacter sp. CACIAM 03H1]
MSAPARIAGMVLAERALPDPFCLVSVRTAGPHRERGHFLPNAEEARTFARELAEQRGLLFVDLTGAGEGEAA